MSTFLLDTYALLWWMADAPELGRAARRTITKPDNQIIVSAASLWEIAIKRRTGRPTGVDEYLARYHELRDRWGFLLASIDPGDAVAAGLMEIPHDDPFDRMLIARSRRLEARIVTCDEAMTRHVRRCVW